MELTFETDLGQTFVIKIDPITELGEIMTLLEAESSIPVNEQSIYHAGRQLSTDPKFNIRQLGVQGEKATLLLRRKVANVGGGSMEQDSELVRLQILNDPPLMAQLQDFQPEMAAAAQSDPARFLELLRQTREGRSNSVTVETAAEQPDIERLTLNDDPPNDVSEAQKEAEAATRLRAIMKNLELALENIPESFARASYLYKGLCFIQSPHYF